MTRRPVAPPAGALALDLGNLLDPEDPARGFDTQDTLFTTDLEPAPTATGGPR